MARLDRICIHGYRAARDVQFVPGELCALVGEAASGKSTVLNAIWSLLESAAPVPTANDVSRGGGGRIHLEAEVAGRTIFLDARPPATLNLNREGAPPTLFFPAALRSGGVVAQATAEAAARAAALVRRNDDENGTGWGAGDGGHALVAGIEALCRRRVRGLVVMVEEPELYLGPQAQRHLYRLLRKLARGGNQVIYSTHSTVFLRVDRIEELGLVRHRRDEGIAVVQPQALTERESFRALAEFDAERAELFLSRAALLVEGRTEKLILPLVFEALGYDPDAEAIAVLETAGKAVMPLFARICNECSIPYVVLHDRDAPDGRDPVESEQFVNAAIAEVAGPDRTVVLVPDFEAVSGVKARARKPRSAWRRYQEEGREIPPALVEAVERVVAAARGKRRRPRGFSPASDDGGSARGRRSRSGRRAKAGAGRSSSPKPA